MFSTNEIKTAVNADSAVLFTYGYFANNLNALRRAVEENKTTLKVFYGRLESVLADKYERRFSTTVGDFSLFYPLDKELNEGRY